MPGATKLAASTGAAQPVPGGRNAKRPRLSALQGQETAIFLVGVALALYFALASPYFATHDNLVTLTQYVAPIMFFATAEVFILILGEIDLSVGQVYVLTPFVVVYLADHGIGPVVGVIASLIVSCVIGLINGLMVVKVRVPSFIATLGTTFALEGLVLVGSNGTQLTPAGQGAFATVLGGAAWSEIIWALALLAVFYLLLRRTTFGLHIIAAGGNEQAATESGIKVNYVKIWCFVLCSVMGGLMGILDGYKIGSLDPATDGLTFMFYGVAAAVLGGTALTGGRGTVIGSGFGAIVLGVLQDGFHILNINAFAYDAILGLAILAAMILNISLERARSGRRRSGSLARALLRIRDPLGKAGAGA